MPTKWKRRRCSNCQNIKVVWKLRKANKLLFCPTCVSDLQKIFTTWMYEPIDKKTIKTKLELKQQFKRS